MGVEIERRFLVDGRNSAPWRKCESIKISQCYLSGVSHIDGEIMWNGKLLVSDERAITSISTWRIRLHDGSVTLTAKGFRKGATGTEYEWPLSIDLYNSLSLDNLPSINKIRYLWAGTDGLLWEVDEFEGDLAGLIIAEVELESEDMEVVIPSWTGLELTHLRGWSNASLSTMIRDSKQN
jgi:CYTH domain-containing protein